LPATPSLGVGRQSPISSDQPPSESVRVWLGLITGDNLVVGGDERIVILEVLKPAALSEPATKTVLARRPAQQVGLTRHDGARNDAARAVTTLRRGR